METANIEELLGRTLGYIQSWWQEPGYGGLIVHPCWNTTNLHFAGPRTSTNSSGVLGFLALYQKFRTQRWLERSIECADVLVSLSKPEGIFRNSTSEGDPEEGCVIHNANPDIALLRLAALLRKEGRDTRRIERYLDVAERNIEWLIREWWTGRRFCGTINQDLCVCIAMVLHQRFTGRGRYENYIQSTLRHIRDMVQTSGELQGAIQRSEEPGGRVFATNYQAAKALFLLELSRLLEDKELLLIAKGVAEFVRRQQRPDGYFIWGYREEEGESLKKEFPLHSSLGIVECGYEFEKLGVKMDWRRYLGLILKDVPLRLVAKGFGGSEERDWRNNIPSSSNISLISSLVKLCKKEPEIIPWDGIVVSEGIDIFGEGHYVYIETKDSIFRIREDPSPALDYGLSKKAELPVIYPSLEDGSSFCVFKDEGHWKRTELDSEKGTVRYVSSMKTRSFSVSEGQMQIVQTPYDGKEIFFEANPRMSLFNSLNVEKEGGVVSVSFTSEKGRNETVLNGLGNWFSITNWSPRLKNGDVRVSFNAPIQRLRIDHTCANPFGKLRVWVRLAPAEELRVRVKVGEEKQS